MRKSYETEKAPSSPPSGERSTASAWIFLVLLIPALLVALLAPENVLSSFPKVDKFTTIFRDFLPAIDRLAAVSTYPELTRLVLSVEWTLVPAQVGLFYICLSRSFDADAFRARRTYLTLIMFLLLGSFLWSTTVFFDATPSDLQGGMYGERLLRLASTSRLGLAIVTSLGISVTALFMAVSCLWVRHLPDIYSRH